jgi:hypothetical protein
MSLGDARCFQRTTQRYIPEDRTLHVFIISNLLTADASDLKFGNLSSRLGCLRFEIPSTSHRNGFLTSDCLFMLKFCNVALSARIYCRMTYKGKNFFFFYSIASIPTLGSTKHPMGTGFFPGCKMAGA